jgi:hypothetical protein
MIKVSGSKKYSDTQIPQLKYYYIHQENELFYNYPARFRDHIELCY